MDHYFKGANVEEELSTGNIPIGCLPDKYGWLLVRGSTKVEKLIAPLQQDLEDEGALVLAGSGSATTKVLTIADLVTKKNKELYQIRREGYRTVQEFWEPSLAELDRLVVTRQIPTLHILLSKSELDPSEPGYRDWRSSPPHHHSARIAASARAGAGGGGGAGGQRKPRRQTRGHTQTC